MFICTCECDYSIHFTFPQKEVTTLGKCYKNNMVCLSGDEKTYKEAGKGVVAVNTNRCNSSVLKALHARAVKRKKPNKSVSSHHVPSDILTCHKAGVVSKYIHYFVLEV